MTARTGLAALRRIRTPAPPTTGEPTAGEPTTGEPTAGEPIAGRPAADERCEFCGEGIFDQHGHVADLVDHRLLCVCRPCYLLFAPRGAGGGRYRGVGEHVRRLESLRLDEATWSLLKIPVDLAFFFVQDDRTLAFYPSPAGATESELDLSAWSTIVADNPVLAELEADVEAALLRRTADDDGTTFSCHLVPIDLCYELVGVVRTHWVGLAGGPEVWAAIEGFFDRLDGRSVPV